MAIIKTTIGIPDKIYILAEEITKKAFADDTV